MDVYNEIANFKSLEKKFSIFRWVLLLFFILIIIGELNSYDENMYTLVIFTVLAFVYVFFITVAAYNKKDKFLIFLKFTKYLDILIITFFIIVRCGLRSEIYILYFIVILFNGAKYGFIGTIQSSLICIASYSVAVVLFTPQEVFSSKLFMIRIVYLILGSYVMYEITKMMNYSNLKEKEAREMSYIDPLTKLPNRTLLSKYFEDFKREYERSKSSFCIVMFDIDNFKEINDSFGHITGDYVLNAVSAKLKDNILYNDFICRFGGEEFVALFHNCSIERAYQISNRIRKEIALVKPLHSVRKITVSVGICEYDNNLSMIENINHADAAMYTAKNAGKNQVVTYEYSTSYRYNLCNK